jgi:hypothetical protein
MTLFDKDEASDLSPKEKKTLKAAIEAELGAREARKERRKGNSRRTRS